MKIISRWRYARATAKWMTILARSEAEYEYDLDFDWHNELLPRSLRFERHRYGDGVGVGTGRGILPARNPAVGQNRR